MLRIGPLTIGICSHRVGELLYTVDIVVVDEIGAEGKVLVADNISTY